MTHRRRSPEPTFAGFLAALKDEYRQFTPEFAEAESGVDRHRIVEVARLIGAARGAFASHVWRGSASGNLGGWQVARAIQLLTVLTASVGTPGGTSPERVEQVQALLLGGAARRTRTGTSFSSRRSGRSATTR